MQAPMDIRIILLHRLAHALEHCLGLLGGSGIIEIDQWLAIDFARQDREVAADGGDIVSRLDGALGNGHMALLWVVSHLPAKSDRASRMPSWLTPSNASATKAPISMDLASASDMPRERR